MDIWQLSIFCKVVESGSFSNAGKAVHLSQPTVSSHIKDLETHFGCRLIDRLSREAVPTKAGELLYDYARRLIALRDETETAMAEFQGQIKGHLVVGGSTIPGVYILPRIVGAFVKAYPDVTLSLRIGDTESVIRDTVSGEVELGIVGATSKDRNIIQEKLVEDEMYVVVPSGHSWAGKKQVDLDMLLQEPFIIREPGSGTRRSIRENLMRLDHELDDLNIVAEMGNTAAVIQGIKNHVGISILSRVAVAEDIENGRLHAMTIRGLRLKRNFYLTTHRNRTGSPLSTAFIRFLKESPADENTAG